MGQLACKLQGGAGPDRKRVAWTVVKMRERGERGRLGQGGREREGDGPLAMEMVRLFTLEGFWFRF